MSKKTKIICTIGPASESKSVLKRMYAAGMNAGRLNTAHDTFREYNRRVRNIRSVADIPIIVDVKGPEVRIDCDKEVGLTKGDVFTVGFGKSDPIRLNRKIYSQVRKDDTLMIADGMIKTRVVKKADGRLRLKCETKNCVIGKSKGVNIPDKRLKVPLLSEKDEKAIEFAIKNRIDYIALSFTRDKRDLDHLKEHLGKAEIGVIAKIENKDGVENIREIIDHSDGVMVARGDLGVELPSERIPIIQKRIIDMCNRRGKISIVATEMLHSMTENPRPTRAETSDVANAILDGADAVMLSSESAMGRYPMESVRVMSRIAREIEEFVPTKRLSYAKNNVSLAIANAVNTVINSIEVDKIIVLTKSGYTARLISNFKTDIDLIAITEDRRVRRKLELVYGVKPVYHNYFPEKNRIKAVAEYCLDRKMVGKDDIVLFTAGVYTQTPSTNMVELHKISEILKYHKDHRY
ncbi:MAG: pyruvate kinase [Candidatus Altiarchaeota archaeon]